MLSSEGANHLRYRSSDPGVYEVYFVEVQDADSRSGLWVRYTICAPKDRPAYAQVWAMYFDRDDPQGKTALQETFDIKDTKRITGQESEGEFCFALGDSAIDNRGCRGRIEQEGRSIEWNLSWGEDKVLVPYPFEWMYHGPFPKTKFYSPHWDARINGHYTCNGRRWSCENQPGQQTHIWGTEHAHRWAWCHVNTFDGNPGVVFEALHGQLKIKGIWVPRLVFIGLRYQGKEYLFNKVSDLVYKNKSHFEPEPSTRDTYPPSTWVLQCETKELQFCCTLSGQIENYIGVTYHDTTGKKLYCNHNKLSDAVLEVREKISEGKWKTVETFKSSSAALEFVGRETDDRVPVLIS